MRRWYWTDYLANGLGNDPASSFYTSANELARLGLLYLNGGSWDGQKILSQGWVRRANTSQTRSVADYRGGLFP